MLSQENTTHTIKNAIILPLFYHHDPITCIAISKALYAGGIRAIEFTNRGEKALANFKILVEERNKTMPDLLLCVGTITNTTDAQLFIETGADVLISPVFDADISDIAYMHKILWIPGCMTPTEIHTAYSAGWSLLKLFPGNVLQPHYVQAIKPLFPKIDFLITGGVEANTENIMEWRKSGAVGVGLGSKLITSSVINKGDMQQLTETVAQLIQFFSNHN